MSPDVPGSSIPADNTDQGYVLKDAEADDFARDDTEHAGWAEQAGSAWSALKKVGLVRHKEHRCINVCCLMQPYMRP